MATFCLLEICIYDNSNLTSTHIAQLVEQFHGKEKIACSIRAVGTKKMIKLSKLRNGFLAVNMNPPGSTNPWHYDTYQGILKKKISHKNNIKTVLRILIFIQPWQWGHFLQVGNEVISHWKSGDVYSWNTGQYHLATNSGIKPRYTIAITGFTDKLPKYKC